MLRRICLYGGPASGKSTMCSRIFSELKVGGHNIEQISEYIKMWVYEGKKPESMDQLYIFSKQCRAEEVVLRTTKHIITDSPIMLVCAYSLLAKCEFSDDLLAMAKKFDKLYPALHLFLDRYDIAYQSHGRYQSHKEAIELDEHIEDVMKRHLDGYIKVKTKDREEIMKVIESQLGGRDGKILRSV